MDVDSVIIEVSEYQKNGGPGHNEWPWKVMDKSKIEKPAHHDKWIMVGNDKGWVRIFKIYFYSNFRLYIHSKSL